MPKTKRAHRDPQHRVFWPLFCLSKQIIAVKRFCIIEFRPASHKENPRVKISLCTLIYCWAVLWCEAWLSRHKYYRFLLIGGAFSASFILCPCTPDCYIPTSNQQIAVYQHSNQSQSHRWTCQISTKLSKRS